MVPDQLTIRVEPSGEYVDLGQFVSVVENTLAILAAIEASVDQRVKRRVHWRIASVALNSPLSITIFPEAPESPSMGREVLAAYTLGLRQIEEQSDRRPKHFSDEALEAAKRLVAPLNSDTRRITFIGPSGEPVSPTQRVAAHADALLPKEHVELGTIEGRLEAISIHRERVFRIWEVFSNLCVECRFTESQLEEARQALSERVAVTGAIRYDRRGRPASISQISRIRVLRPQGKLPQASDLEGTTVLAGDAKDEL